MDDLREALVGIGYLNPANPEAILAELRALITRAGPSPREMSLLRGLARQVRWAAQQIARPRSGDDNLPPA
jgi:tRNA/rRNA methyltransferase